jgi:integrase
MSTALTIIEPNNALAAAGQAANRAASANVIEDYRSRRAPQTLRRQDGDLALFESYLHSIPDVFVCNLASRPDCWRGITRGIVKAFVQWQLNKGYALGSVNARLATVKVYSGLAHDAGTIDTDEYLRIKDVKGYSFKEAKRVDEKRETTRRTTNSNGVASNKKATAVTLTKEQADSLKKQPDTPQGRRDALLMCLLLDHGLRCGEVAMLQIVNFDLKAGTFTFYRPKVSKEQTHKMTTDTIRAAAAYLNHDASALGPILRGSRKGGQLGGTMGERSINDRVGQLGRASGITGLSPHDCRHYWATRAARQGTDPFALQDAGGWNSLAMPRRYVESAKIANEGVRL